MLRSSRCGLGFFYKFCIGGFSCLDESPSVEPGESFPLYMHFSAYKSNCLPLVASLFDFEPCSKHIGDR
jgi:hypothetical protein